MRLFNNISAYLTGKHLWSNTFHILPPKVYNYTTEQEKYFIKGILRSKNTFKNTSGYIFTANSFAEADAIRYYCKKYLKLRVQVIYGTYVKFPLDVFEKLR